VTPLQWKETLFLDLPAMDQPSQQLAALLEQACAASDADLVDRWQQLVAHTEAQFEREDHWMRQTGYPSTRVHSVQHKVVLQAMREGLQNAGAGQLPLIRTMARELGTWFAQHNQSLDAALALHLRKTGYDPARGVLSMPVDSVTI